MSTILSLIVSIWCHRLNSSKCPKFEELNMNVLIFLLVVTNVVKDSKMTGLSLYQTSVTVHLSLLALAKIMWIIKAYPNIKAQYHPECTAGISCS